jgi:glycosyltransferase involved in cell wall biosynthesis
MDPLLSGEMRPVRRRQLAELLREQRVRLERDLVEVAGRGAVTTAEEARLIAAEVSERLLDVERELRAPGLLRHYLPAPARRLAHRLRGLFRPRLGRLRHYPPRPMRLAAHYWGAAAPNPAPSICLVTPSFQHGRFIERTVQSVIGQRYPGLEYVVQDGGSTDGTREILQRYTHSLSRWVSEPDGGHADALNRGFSWTNGEIMGWINSDDVLLPGALAFVATYLADHPEVDVVYGNRLMIDDCDYEIGAWILPSHDDDALRLADFVPQETLFWRRRIWDAVGARLDTSFAYALDWDLLLRFQQAGAVMVRLPRFIGAFRVHDEQKTSTDYSVGIDEMARLRERVHGRPLSQAEINRRLRPYLRRHVRAHLRQRVLDRLPGRRESVTIDPMREMRASSAAMGTPGEPRVLHHARRCDVEHFEHPQTR